MTMGEERWHIVEARRDDGMPTMFRIREIEPDARLDTIFVVEMPYETTDAARLPTAAAYRRLAEFDDRWLRPACSDLGWQLVGSKTENGAFFLYMYGAGSPDALATRLAPYDARLAFYDDTDPQWLEYGTLRELLDQAMALPQLEQQLGASPALDADVDAVHAPTSAAKKPAAKKPAAKKPAAKKPAATKSAAKKPTATKPAATKPDAKKPAAKKPAATKPAASKPAGSKRSRSAPAGAERGTSTTPGQRSSRPGQPGKRSPGAAKPGRRGGRG